MTRRLDRYVLTEILGPLALGFLVYTFILLMQFLFRSADLIIRRGLPVGVVARLLVTTLPNILVLTIPMSLLFGILVAVGRLASDSELIAMRSSGISLFALYRPILALSTGLTVVNLGLMLYALPWGNHALQQLRLQILTQSATQQIDARVFDERWTGQVIYVFETPATERDWKGVFLAPSVPTPEQEVTVADRGHVEVDPRGERAVLHLENAVTHKVDLAHPERYEVSRSVSLEKVLASSSPPQVVVSKGMRESTIAELRQTIADPSTPAEMRRLAYVEIHKKFAIPAACLVFGLFALPLGFNNRRGGKSSGFTLSLAVILVYYVLLNNGEDAARVGSIQPWLAMWAPNLMLTVAGVFFSLRRNRDKSMLITRLDRWARHRLAGRIAALRRAWRKWRAGRSPQEPRRTRIRRQLDRVTPNLLLRLPRPRLAFPNRLDRYVMRAFAWSLGVVTLSCMTIYIVADVTEIFNDVLKNKIGAGLLFVYYKFLSFQIFYDIAPIVVLVATLVTFSLLARTHEVIACKALGVSLYRLSLPALAIGLGVTAFCAFLQAQVLPASNQRVAAIKDRMKGRESARTYRRADRQWLFGQGRYVYNYTHFDPKQQTLQQLQIFEFDSNYRLVRRLFAASARYVGSRWVFSSSWVRTFKGADVTSYASYPGAILVDYPETPAYFDSETKKPDEMDYGELRAYVGDLRASGQTAPDLEVELYSKIAFPFISLVMGLVALPFAFRLGRRGGLYSLGVSVVLGMVLLGVFAFFKTMGQTGALPPLIAAWSPAVIFSLFSGYLFLGLET